MAQVIDLDELVPDDLIFKYRGEEYTIPGDLATEDVMKLMKFFRAIAPVLGKNVPDAKGQRALREAEKHLLALFQIKHPEMTKLPFGARSFVHVIQGLLKQLGVIVGEEDGDARPPASRTSRRRSTSSSARARRKS